MLKGIRKFFDSHIQSISGGHAPETAERAIQLATASLLIEVSRADFHISNEEKEVIVNSVQTLFKLSRQETRELVELAESEINSKTCLYEFTSLVNEYFDYDQKLSVVENMWRVALVDLDRDKYEEHIIRKVCDLIYVSHKDFIRLRHNVEQSSAGG